MNDIEPILERAAQRGACEALRRIGLHDENAAKDIGELRTLLEAWKDTKVTARRTVTRLIVRVVLLMIAGAVGYYFNPLD